MSRRARAKRHGVEKVICYRVSDNVEEQEEYQHDVPVSTTDLNYQGQKLKVNIEQFHDLRRLTDGEYGPLLIASIDGQPNTEMIVEKLSAILRRKDPICPADLSTIESLNIKNCPYILTYHGVIFDKESAQFLFCMETMDVSMENFYKTLHSLDNLTNVIEWKHILCRLINNVVSALNFLTINGVNHRFLKPSTILVNKQAVFKLCDVGFTIQDTFLDEYPSPRMWYYYSSAIVLKDSGHNIHPGMWTFGLNILEISCIKNVNESAASSELEFVTRIIDTITSESDRFD